MAGRYRKIETRIWNDAKFQSLSERGKLVFLFLLTHPNLTMLGAMRATVPGLAAELGVDFEGFREAFQEGLRKGMVKHDAEASFVWMPNFLRYNKPESPNVVKSWPYAWELLPECSLKFELAQRVRDFVKGLTEAFQEAFAEAFLKGWPNQEQEQEQERKPSAANASVTDDGSEPVSICNKLKEIGTGRTREKEGISAQHPVEIIPPKTTQHSPGIIPPRESATLETPDGLGPTQYARMLLEEIRFPIVPQKIQAVAAAIEHEAKTMDVMSAYEFVLECTKFKIFEEHEIDNSFFTEGKYKQEWRNSNARQISNGSPMPEQINPSSEQNSRSDQGGTPTSKKAAKPPSHEACKLAALLKSEILRNKPDYRITPAQIRKWELTTDRMLLLDGRSPDQIAELIRWVQHDEFWMANVLSMDTLRDKFDQLSMKAELKTRAGDKSAPVELPTGYVPASERIRQERNAQTRGAQ